MLPSSNKNRFFLFSFWTFFALIVITLRAPLAYSCEYKENQPNLADAGVVIYSTSWCPYCTQAVNFLDDLQINYTKCDIEKSPVAEMKFKQLGGETVPLIYVGETRIDGFKPNEIEGALQQTIFDFNA